MLVINLRKIFFTIFVNNKVQYFFVEYIFFELFLATNMEIQPTTSNGLHNSLLVEETMEHIGSNDGEDEEELVEPRFRYKRILGDLMRVCCIFIYLQSKNLF